MTLPRPIQPPVLGHPIWRRVARACVVIAGVFCVFVVAMLGILWIQQKMHHPLVETATGTIAILRDQLQTRPADESLKNQVRQADIDLRRSFWTRRTRMERGTWLLLTGAAVLVTGLKTMRSLDRRIPNREQILAPDHSAAEMRWAQLTVGGVGGAITLLLLAGAWWSLGHPVITLQQDVPPVAETPVTVEQLLTQWPVFRGFGGSEARIPDPPVRTWNGTSGQNILWRAPVALPGNSSPIIWNDKIVVTGATESQRRVMAIDLDTGKSLWQTSIGGAGPVPEISDETSFAAPSPVTDGFRAYAIFATGDIGAVDLATGRKVWEKNLGKPDSAHGYAASLAIFPAAAGAEIIVQWDMASADDNKSSLIALDGRTGRLLWQTKRPVGASWASPLVTHVEDDPIPWQIVTAANPWVIGYNAATGDELWRVAALGGDVAPSPAAAVYHSKTVVFTAEEGSRRAAFPINNARGNLTPAWIRNDEGLPNIVSPVSDGRYVWTLIDSGVLFCFDADTGKRVWQHEFSAKFYATPTLVGAGQARELWLTETTGITHRVAVAAVFKELGVSSLGENVAASMAFSDASGITRLLIRGENNLYCIGSPTAAAAEAK